MNSILHQPSTYKNKARVILVGTGTMGIIRARDIYANPRFDLRAICDINITRAKEFADLYSCESFSSLDEAIEFFGYPTVSSQHIHPNHSVSDDNNSEDMSQEGSYGTCTSMDHSTSCTSNLSSSVIASSSQGIDGVILSVPTPLHPKYIELAAQHNLAIFVEKPVAESSSEVRSLIKLCEGHDVTLCCGFQRRFDASYLSAAEKVRSGKIGNPLSSTIFFGDHPCPPIEFLKDGGNIFSDLAVHDVNYIQYALNDKVESVYARAINSSQELKDAGVHDTAIILLHFSKGALVTITLNRRSKYGYDQRCEIFGEEGMVQVGNELCDSIVHFSENGSVHANLKNSYPERYRQAYQSEMDCFANVILKGTKWPGKILVFVRHEIFWTASQDFTRDIFVTLKKVSYDELIDDLRIVEAANKSHEADKTIYLS